MWERGGVESLVPGVQSLCTGEESEALAPNSAHAPTVREDPNLSSNPSKSVKMGFYHRYSSGQSPPAMGWRVRVDKPVCVVSNVGRAV